MYFLNNKCVFLYNDFIFKGPLTLLNRDSNVLKKMYE